MEIKRIVDDLPEIYDHLFPDFFQQSIPQETLATCHDCAMCEKAGQLHFPGQEYYRPDTKCCTYHPKIPNYLIGGLLLDTNPAMDQGRLRVREKIQKRIGVTPSSILPPKKYSLLHKSVGERGYGKNRSLVCPYYLSDAGLCSVWKFRDAVCSTYFCKSVAGQEGKRFWNVLTGYLMQAQDSLTWYALLNLGWEVEPLWNFLTSYTSDALESQDVDELPPPEDMYRKIWGNWVGKEEEVYKKAYEIVAALSREEYERISGMNQKIFLEWMKERRKEVVAPAMGQMLRCNPDMRAMQAADGTYAIKTQAGIFTIEAALYEVLGMFDGKKTLDEVKDLVLEKWDAPLEDELLISMFQSRMLLPVKS